MFPAAHSCKVFLRISSLMLPDGVLPELLCEDAAFLKASRISSWYPFKLFKVRSTSETALAPGRITIKSMKRASMKIHTRMNWIFVGTCSSHSSDLKFLWSVMYKIDMFYGFYPILGLLPELILIIKH